MRLPADLADLSRLDALHRSVGFEQEYEVFADNDQVDFRRLIKNFADASGGTICPAGELDTYLDTGALLFCDGWEAEMAAVPELIGPAIFHDLPDSARHLRGDLFDFIGLPGPGQYPAPSIRG